jgi:hypothetical protein
LRRGVTAPRTQGGLDVDSIVAAVLKNIEGMR